MMIKWLVLMLALMNLVCGKAMNSKKVKRTPGEQRRENCPTHEDFRFPDGMKVPIPVFDPNPGNFTPQDARNRSLSPWDSRINVDPNRYPRDIFEANCRYDACISATGKGLDYGLNSVPIQQEILVLRHKRAGCQKTYWLEKQMVTVGCTCAFSATYTVTKPGQN